MAPRKRKAEEVAAGGEAGEEGKEQGVETALTGVTRSVAAVSTRVTRSMSRGAESNSTGAAPAALLPKKGKGNPVEEQKKKKKKKNKGKAAAEKKEAKEEVKEEEGEEEDGKDADAARVESKEKTIVIEHCKQCNSFKTRAVQVKNGLEKAFPRINVLLNPDKPRRGCFEIREEGGETFISLLDMKRPFKPMKALDMDEVISDIIDKVK